MKHFLSIILISCLSLTSCSDSGSDYLGTWVMRGQPIHLTISKESNTYQVVGSIAFEGAYVLDDQNRLVNYSMDNTRFEYNAENDVLVWPGNEMWSGTEVFERATIADQNTQSDENNDCVVTVPAPVTPQIADTNGFVGRWKAQYNYYAYTMTVYLDISNGADSYNEYHCVWSAQDNTGGNKDTRSWCATSSNRFLEADTKMGGRRVHLLAHAGANENELSVTFTYNSDEYLPWQLQFIKQ